MKLDRARALVVVVGCLSQMLACTNPTDDPDAETTGTRTSALHAPPPAGMVFAEMVADASAPSGNALQVTYSFLGSVTVAKELDIAYAADFGNGSEAVTLASTVTTSGWASPTTTVTARYVGNLGGVVGSFTPPASLPKAGALHPQYTFWDLYLPRKLCWVSDKSPNPPGCT